jgi:hypothetical protein
VLLPADVTTGFALKEVALRLRLPGAIKDGYFVKVDATTAHQFHVGAPSAERATPRMTTYTTSALPYPPGVGFYVKVAPDESTYYPGNPPIPAIQGPPVRQ